MLTHQHLFSVIMQQLLMMSILTLPSLKRSTKGNKGDIHDVNLTNLNKNKSCKLSKKKKIFSNKIFLLFLESSLI